MTRDFVAGESRAAVAGRGRRCAGHLAMAKMTTIRPRLGLKLSTDLEVIGNVFLL